MEGFPGGTRQMHNTDIIYLADRGAPWQNKVQPDALVSFFVFLRELQVKGYLKDQRGLLSYTTDKPSTT